MAITNISRDWGNFPAIVRIISTDTLSTVGTADYIFDQADNIEEINSGEFQWQESDMVLVYASDGWGFFTISADFQSLDAFVFVPGVTLPTVVGNIAEFDSTGGNLADSGIASSDILLKALAQNHIFVGSAGGVATDVAMSGDATIAASGALTIANNAITTAKILNSNVTLGKLAAGITPSHIVKFASQVTTVGGASSEAFTVTGAAATDLAFVQVVDNGTGNVTVLQAVVTLNTLTVTFSGDPGNDTVINYQLLRAAA